MPSKIVFVMPMTVNEEQLTKMIKEINRDVDQEGGELTLEEVCGNTLLLEYICSEALKDGQAIVDPFEFWNGDGWCDWECFR